MTDPQEPQGQVPSSGSPTADCPARPARLCCGPWRACSAALLGGLITWGLLQCCFPVFEIPVELQDLPSPQPPDLAAKAAAATVVATRWNAVLTLGILGFAAAALLAVVEAFSRGVAASAWWRALTSGLVAGGLAAAGGFVASLLLVSPALLAELSPLARTIAVHCAGLGILGLGIGAGVGLATGSGRLVVQAGLAGLLGGVLVGFLYPPLMAFLLPIAKTERVIPLEATSQLIWVVSAALLPTLVMTGLGGNKPR